MKTFLRCALATVFMGLGWSFVIIYYFNKTTHPNRDLVISLFVFLACIFIAVCIMKPYCVSKRLYGIYICHKAHQHLSMNGIHQDRATKKLMLEDLTGCSSYWELYRYASKEEYFQR